MYDCKEQGVSCHEALKVTDLSTQDLAALHFLSTSQRELGRISR